MGQIIYSFFWWLAGANRKILKEHIADHNKYFQIGVAVLITAMMAVFTGGIAFHYAINKGFEGNISFATIFASILWGFIILNLDRFLVLSMQKQGNSLIQPTAYEKFQNFIGEFVFAIPRILLAILIANVILAPLELYLFKDQISNHISIINEHEKEKFINTKSKEFKKIEDKYFKDKELIENKYKNLIEPLNSEIIVLKKQIDTFRTSNSNDLNKLKEDRTLAIKIASDNRRATINERNNGGCGKKCKQLGQLQILYDKKVEELNTLIQDIQNKKRLELYENTSKIKKLKEQIKLKKEKISRIKSNKSLELNKLFKKRQKIEQNIENEINQYKNEYKGNNIMIALKAKNALFKTDSMYKAIHWLLTSLLITIELLPLIVKLLLSRSSYDAHIQRISDEESMKHDTFIRDAKIKHQMLFKSLRLKENIKYENLEKELKKVKFATSE